jgi:hypothetical protein
MRWARVTHALGAGLLTPPKCLTDRSPSFGVSSASTNTSETWVCDERGRRIGRASRRGREPRAERKLVWRVRETRAQRKLAWRGHETRAERRAVAALARGDAYFQQSDPPGSFPAPLHGEIENAQDQNAPASVSASQSRRWRAPVAGASGSCECDRIAGNSIPAGCMKEISRARGYDVTTWTADAQELGAVRASVKRIGRLTDACGAAKSDSGLGRGRRRVRRPH